MIDRTHVLSMCRQAKLIGTSHSSVYYLPRPVSDADLVLMRRVDELRLEHPFAGARMLGRILRREYLPAARNAQTALKTPWSEPLSMDARDNH